MLHIILPFLFFVAGTCVLILSARSDWKGMIIPNGHSLVLVGVFIAGTIITLIDPSYVAMPFLPGLAAGAIVFAVTIALYVGRAMGGGDTKLASATALVAGIGFLDVFLLVMALTGGVLATYALLARKHPTLLPASPPAGTWLAQLKDGQNKVPYGIAIAAGGIAALADKWLLTHVS